MTWFLVALLVVSTVLDVLMLRSLTRMIEDVDRRVRTHAQLIDVHGVAISDVNHRLDGRAAPLSGGGE